MSKCKVIADIGGVSQQFVFIGCQQLEAWLSLAPLKFSAWRGGRFMLCNKGFLLQYNNKNLKILLLLIEHYSMLQIILRTFIYTVLESILITTTIIVTIWPELC